MVGPHSLLALGASAMIVECGTQGNDASVSTPSDPIVARPGAVAQTIDVGETVSFSMYALRR